MCQPGCLACRLSGISARAPAVHCLLAPQLTLPLCTTGVAGFLYNSSRGSTYLFSTSDANFSSAEQSCKDQGGHLASWAVEQEQVG